MVRLTQEQYETVLVALPASLRKTLRAEASFGGSDAVTFGDGIANDIYNELMEYVVLHTLDRDQDITSRGREIERIADLIFDQSGG